ncbi:MAG: DUF433 domain-containing protein [Candidatus Heimdallarchaeota archaeon]|nr:DUF433 domain-containing protein [Candidatus Heimdallarchaeota archaeon]MCK5047988.1 DUF433 domain-containing protein [Candidatus Heimdallarchaeota archaeon]
MSSFRHRIETNPKVMVGQPVIKDTRIPVYIILQMLKDGASFEKIKAEYPDLEDDDIRAVLEYSIYLVTHENEKIIQLDLEG